MALNFTNIFTDTNSAGLAESFREFLGYFVKQFFPLVNTQIERLYLARFDYPLLVLPVFLLAIIGLYSFWKNPDKKTALGAGLSASLLFYFYFHYWVYWAVVIGLLLAYVLIFERKDRALIKNFLILIGVYSAASLPYFINYLLFALSGSSHEYALRLGVAEGREFGLATLGFAYLAYALLAAVSYFLYWRKDNKKAVMIWAFLAAAAIVWNIQLITGFVPAPNNWRRTISILLYVICALILYDLTQLLIRRFPALKKIALGAVILLTVFVATKKINNVWAIWRDPESRILESYRFSKDLTDSWSWINSNLGKEPKIISNSFMTSLYLNAYTSARPFLPLGNQTSQPNINIEDRFLTAEKIFGVNAETLRATLLSTLPLKCSSDPCPPNSEDNLRKNLWHLYSQYFRQTAINGYLANPGSISPAFADSLVKKYGDTKIDWAKLNGQYIYLGLWEGQLSNPNFDTNKIMKLVYQNPSVRIYQVKILK